jgi:succinyl-CoA---D-citramalate CoA-transferase
MSTEMKTRIGSGYFQPSRMDHPKASERAEGEQGGPLAGLRVVELGVLIAGPFAGRMLADFGAEVIKVEAPGRGDPLREWGAHRHGDRALWWPVQARNKKLVTLDLRKPEGQELARRLISKADVLLENFKPGTLEGWGLGPERLLEVNPRLVMARISGYGQTGPYARRAGFAVAGEAMGGLRFINGSPGEVPPRLGVSLGDSLAALYAVQGILLALYRRDHGGGGQVVDASIMESCFQMLDSIVPEYGKLGIVRQPSGTRIGHAAPSNVYRARDGKLIAIGANGDSLWQRLCQVMGRPDLAADERFKHDPGRLAHSDLLDQEIGKWVGERDGEEVDRLLNDAGVVSGPVYSIADIFDDPQYQARDMLLRVDAGEVGELVMPGIAPKLSETPGAVRWAGSWELGAHNREVYGELLGVPSEELERLRAAGVV